MKKKRRKKQTLGLLNSTFNNRAAETLINGGFSLKEVRKFLKNRRGQTAFINLIVLILVGAIFVFASPVLFEMVGYGASQTEGLTAVVITLFPYVVGLLILFVGIRSVIGSES